MEQQYVLGHDGCLVSFIAARFDGDGFRVFYFEWGDSVPGRQESVGAVRLHTSTGAVWCAVQVENMMNRATDRARRLVTVAAVPAGLAQPSHGDYVISSGGFFLAGVEWRRAGRGLSLRRAHWIAGRPRVPHEGPTILAQRAPEKILRYIPNGPDGPSRMARLPE